MSKNIGKIDSILRIIFGFILLLLLIKTSLILIGLFLIFTALINFCPIYKLSGINTFNRPANNQENSSLNEKNSPINLEKDISQLQNSTNKV